MKAKTGRGQPYDIWRFFLVDLEGLTVRPLMDAPHYGGSKYLWSPDSRSLILDMAYAPLENIDPAERQQRQAGPFLYEYELATGAITMINDQKKARYEPLSWDASSNTLLVRQGDGDRTVTAFHKEGRAWRKGEPVPSSNRAIDVTVEQGLNYPPRLIAIVRATGREHLLLDLNPELSHCTLGKVTGIEWKAADGQHEKGGLYLPPGYSPGHRYPLVIQTHGWEPDTFSPVGPFTSALAAQALANQGFAVVQMDERFRGTAVTPREGPRVIAAWEGLVDYLDTRGIINRKRVGLIGFSRSCFAVKYALVHSRYPYAAAIVFDGIDTGYYQYVTCPGPVSGEFEAMNGGMPYGEGFQSWLKVVPGFHLQDVTTPLLIESPHRRCAIGEWEWFAGLRGLEKPVEMVVFEDDDHQLIKPWNRLSSGQLTVDWMKFWLQGREDSAPGKADQYARWRELRRLQKTAPCSRESKRS